MHLADESGLGIACFALPHFLRSSDFPSTWTARNAQKYESSVRSILLGNTALAPPRYLASPLAIFILLLSFFYLPPSGEMKRTAIYTFGVETASDELQNFPRFVHTVFTSIHVRKIRSESTRFYYVICSRVSVLSNIIPS